MKRRETEVPEIVDRKCREAYDLILNECKNKENIKRRRFGFKNCETKESEMSVISGVSSGKNRSFNLGKCLAIVACAAMMGVFTIPMMAEYIPALQNAFNTTDKSSSEKETVFKKYAASSKTNQDEKINYADVFLRAVFCDPNNVYISLKLTPTSDFFNDCTSITAFGEISIDGNLISYTDTKNDGSSYPDIRFIKNDDGNFYSNICFNDLIIKDNSTLNININSLQGENAYIHNGVLDEDFSIVYYPETTELVANESEFSYSLIPYGNQNTVYEIKEILDDFSVFDAVEVSPFMTMVYSDNLGENRLILIRDQDGNELERISDYKFAPPLTTSDTLIIEIYETDVDSLSPLYVFEVPIDNLSCRYYSNDFENNNDNIDWSKVVYNTPYKEIYNKLTEMLNSGEIKTEPVGAKILTDVITEEESSGDTVQENSNDSELDVRITGSGLDSAYNYNIDDEIIKNYKAEFGADTKILLVDYEITNPTDSVISDYFRPCEIYQKDLKSLFDSESYNHDTPITIELVYKSYGDYSNYYDFEPHETYKITYGYLVTETAAKAGFWACPIDFDIFSIVKGKAKLYEIE